MLKYGEKKKILGFYRNILYSDWFLVKIKVIDWVEGNFFSLTVFGGNFFCTLVAGVYTQAWQWIGMSNLHLPTHLRPGLVF